LVQFKLTDEDLKNCFESVMSLNSTLVQFKQLIELLKAIAKMRKSQFHFGSIQTALKIRKEEIPMVMSQFHFGSIQTPICQEDPIQSRARLNSTLVQFKHYYTIAGEYGGTISLNSTLVQFKRPHSGVNNTWYWESQFHFGSIQTGGLPKDTSSFMMSLNSTLVQFKQKKSLLRIKNILSQFHFGSIQTKRYEYKGDIALCYVSIPLWFNSNFLSKHCLYMRQ